MSSDCNTTNFKVLIHKERKCAKDSRDEADSGTSTPKKTPKGSKESLKDEVPRNVKSTEFFSVLQDPACKKDITIIHETLTEETREHSKCRDGPTANRYRFCREIIKPYLDPNLCPKTKEELVEIVIDSAQQDFKDCGPCFSNLNELKEEGTDPEKPKRPRFGLNPNASCPGSSPMIICSEDKSIGSPCCPAKRGLYDDIVCKYKPNECKLEKKPDPCCPTNKPCRSPEPTFFDMIAKLIPFDCNHEKNIPNSPSEPCCPPKPDPCCPPKPCPTKPPKQDPCCPPKPSCLPKPEPCCPPKPGSPRITNPRCPPKPKPCCPPKKPDPCCPPKPEPCPNMAPMPCPDRGKGPSIDDLIAKGKTYINLEKHEGAVCAIKSAVRDVVGKATTTTKEVAKESNALNDALKKTGDFLSECNRYVREKAESFCGCSKEPKDPGKKPKKCANVTSEGRYLLDDNEDYDILTKLQTTVTSVVTSAKEQMDITKIFEEDYSSAYGRSFIEESFIEESAKASKSSKTLISSLIEIEANSDKTILDENEETDKLSENLIKPLAFTPPEVKLSEHSDLLCDDCSTKLESSSNYFTDIKEARTDNNSFGKVTPAAISFTKLQENELNERTSDTSFDKEELTKYNEIIKPENTSTKPPETRDTMFSVIKDHISAMIYEKDSSRRLTVTKEVIEEDSGESD